MSAGVQHCFNAVSLTYSDVSGCGAPGVTNRCGLPCTHTTVIVKFDLPTAETDAAFWSAVVRGVSLLGLGLVAAVLGILIAVRPVTISRPAAA